MRTVGSSIVIAAIVATMGCGVAAKGQAAGTGAGAATGPATQSVVTPVAPGKVFDDSFSGFEKLFVGAAEAMPADKYNFVPTTGEYKGVRTFAQQVNHITSANYGFFSGFGIEKPTVDMASINKLTSKDDVVKALKESFVYAHKALQSITPDNAFLPITMFGHTSTRAGVAVHAVGHGEDIYGQLVEYLRLNGIVPPASQK